VAIAVTGMVPGDTSTTTMNITNNGSATLRYSMAATATNLLGDTLTLTVKTQGTDCATFNGATVLAATTLDGAAIGSATQGDQTGDRTLAPGSEVLCFRFTLPTSADDALQGASSAATFTFDAEQVANNP
jgi:hypothetical protein